MRELRHARALVAGDAESVRLRRQWALLRESDVGPVGWTYIRLTSELVLVHHPETPVVWSADPEVKAALIGTPVRPITPGADLGELLGRRICRDARARSELLRELGGVYALLIADEIGLHLYTDPGALMAVFYGNGRAASTPTLLPGLERDQAVDRTYPLGGSDDWYPGDVTPFVGVRALLANHGLEVATGRTERFWPLAAPDPISKSEGLALLADQLQGMARAYLGTGPCLFSLTGGQDSRVNLAAIRPWVDHQEFFTIRGPTIKACDLESAAELARRFGLNHRFVENEVAPGWLEDTYAEICAGMQTRGASSVIGACRRIASPSYIHVSGALGAITKSMFWPSKRPTRVTTRALANEFVSRSPLIGEALGRWAGTLDPGLPAPMVYSLMYLEQRGGRWQSVSDLGSNLFFRPGSLFASRQVFETVASMPVSDQYGGGLLFDVTRLLWPELLEVPYCKVTSNYGTYLPKWARVAGKRLLGRAG